MASSGSPPFDLVISGGTVVTSAASAVADVGIRDGTVVQIGGGMRGRRQLDAGGALVMPGGVDLHVHLSASGGPGRFVDDMATGTRAAAAGGITTVGQMTLRGSGRCPRPSRVPRHPDLDPL